MTKAKGSALRAASKLKPPFNLEAEKKRLPDVYEEFFWKKLEACYPHTLLRAEKMFNLYEATQYIARRRIPGDFVECGVFLGGAVMLMAETLSNLGVEDKKIYLYDTFSGFTGDITDADINYRGENLGQHQMHNFLELTRSNVAQTGYPQEKFLFREGDVQETLTSGLPEQISLLRLDTDTYASTLCELEHLYPKLVQGGVLILDDYGYSKGVRKAVDEYFSAIGETLFFQRPNFSSRTAIKN